MALRLEFLRNWCPPQLKTWLTANKNVRFSGCYGSWPAAMAKSDGYAAQIILQRAEEAAKKVLNGQAAYERDTVCFAENTIDVGFWCAWLWSGKGGIVDVGGALGSSFFRHQKILMSNGLPFYHVVEQPDFVAAGRRLNVEKLSFFDNFPAAVSRVKPSLAVLASVLGYLERPEELLRQLTAAQIEFVFIDRTLFGQSRIAVEYTPPQLGGASYPVRVFDRNELLTKYFSEYELLWEFSALEGQVKLTKPSATAESCGMLLKRRRA